MKKQLLCTSAIALGVATAGPTLAQEWDVRVGGYYTFHIGVNDLSGNAFDEGRTLFDSDYEGLDTLQDAEVHVIPSITLDNGLTFGANIQFETADSSGGNDMDEVYIEISGDQLGRILLGSENSAGALSMVNAPNVALMPIDSPSTSGFVPSVDAGFVASPTSGDALGGFAFRQASYTAFTEVSGNDDIQRLTYFTPSFNGFTLGLSYAPDDQESDGGSGITNNNANGVISNIFDIGVSYEQTFGTTDVAFGARWGTGKANDFTTVDTDDIFGEDSSITFTSSNPETWGIGAQVTFNGVTFGGHYAANKTGFQDGLYDSQGYSLGIAYDIPGPWSVSFTAMLSEIDGKGTFEIDGGPSAGTVTTTNNHERQAYILGANRNLGPGVDWSIWVFYEEFSADANSPLALVETGSTTDQYELKGTVLGTSIGLSF